MRANRGHSHPDHVRKSAHYAQRNCNASIEAAEAGASIIHLHARDPENGKPDPNPDLFMEFLPRIKQSTDAVMNISTGGGLGMTR